MKHPLLTILLLSATLLACRQTEKINPLVNPGKNKPADTAVTNPLVAIDKSPMDIATYPDKYSILRMQQESQPQPYIRVIYSRPHKKHRTVFGEGQQVIVPYGAPWRLGANEATEIEFFTNVSINGNNVPRGRYTLYAIPQAGKWTLALNKNLFNWGLQIDASQDLLRTELPVTLQQPAIEDFTIFFEDTEGGAAMNMVWDSVRTVLYIDFAKN